MGLTSAWKSFVHGNFSDALNYAFVDEELVQSGMKADRALEQMANEDYIEGAITDQEYKNRLARYNVNANPTYDNSVGGIFDQGNSPIDGLKQGAAEGARNIKRTIQEASNGLTGFVLGAIPWQLWVALAVYLLIVTWPFLGSKLVPKANP
jgi:hypothetical protein